MSVSTHGHPQVWDWSLLGFKFETTTNITLTGASARVSGAFAARKRLLSETIRVAHAFDTSVLIRRRCLCAARRDCKKCETTGAGAEGGHVALSEASIR